MSTVSRDLLLLWAVDLQQQRRRRLLMLKTDVVNVDVNVAKIAGLLQSPRRRRRITVGLLYQELADEKNVLDVDGRQAGKKTIGCHMARSSIRVMQRLGEMYVDR